MYWFSEMCILPREHWAAFTRALSGSCALSITLSKHRNHRRCSVTLAPAWPAGLEISLVKVCYVLASNCSNTDAACVKEAFCSESTDKYWSSIEPGERAGAAQWRAIGAERGPTAQELRILKGLLFADRAKLDVRLIPPANVVTGV